MAALDPDRAAAWRQLLTTHATLTRALTQALYDERGLPLPWFEILNALRDAGGRVRVMALVDHLVVSASSLSRQLTRMEDEGFIRRERGGLGDDRAVVAVITKEGRDAWRSANTVYQRVAKKQFLNRLSDADVAALLRVLTKAAP